MEDILKEILSEIKSIKEKIDSISDDVEFIQHKQFKHEEELFKLKKKILNEIKL